MQKKVSNVLGYKINCGNFNPCPLCYGCRNYDSSILSCERCYIDNKKFNICDTKKHNTKTLSKMIKRKSVILQEK